MKTSMRNFTESQIDEMVFLAKKFRSYSKAAKEFGCSYQTIADRCHKRGFHLPSTHDIAAKKKKKVVDGVTFFWCEKIGYRGTVNGKRISLADYCYQKKFGVPKPTGTNIWFMDGNRENYELENLEFVTSSEYMKRMQKNPEVRKRSIDALDKGRIINIELEKEKPWLSKRRMHRSWKTRRTQDPDNESAKQGVMTRRRNAEARGYFYSPETLQRLSLSHKGKKHSINRIKQQQDAIRRKMGIA